MTAYLTPDDLRDLQPDLEDSNKYSDTLLTSLISEFEGVAESYVGCAYTTRTVTGETVELDRDRWVNLAHVRVVTVSSLTITYLGQTTTFTSTQYQVDKRGGAIDLLGHYTGTATVTYTHGISSPPDELLGACSEYVRARALQTVNSKVARDVIRQGPDGLMQISTPDWKNGRPTGFLVVDGLLNSLKRKAPGVG